MGCICDGESVVCAKMDLWWALYNLQKEIPILRMIAEEPEPCYERLLKSEVMHNESD